MACYVFSLVFYFSPVSLPLLPRAGMGRGASVAPRAGGGVGAVSGEETAPMAPDPRRGATNQGRGQSQLEVNRAGYGGPRGGSARGRGGLCA